MTSTSQGQEHMLAALQLLSSADNAMERLKYLTMMAMANSPPEAISPLLMPIFLDELKSRCTKALHEADKVLDDRRLGRLGSYMCMHMHT